MSVAAAPGAVSTHQHQQATADQIRLAQLIDDKKHDQPEVQEIIRKVLDVVANSTQEEALVALFDCDYDYEKAVALLIEKGHDIASEWRTATNHKLTKKQQQQQKNAATKNGYGGETDENGQQRGNDGYTNRGKSRGGRARFQSQPNGGDFHSNNQQQQQQQSNDNYQPQQRQRGGSGNRGRNRGNNRSGQRGNDRNHQSYEQQQQPQDFNIDTSSPSDTTQRFPDVSYANRRGPAGATGKQQPQQKQQPWDVGNWNGETVIYSRRPKDEEQSSTSDNNNVSNTLDGSSGVSKTQLSSLGGSNVNTASELNTQHKLKSEFDPVEAARQIKNVIGIGQSQQSQQINASPPKPLMDVQPYMTHQSVGQQAKPNAIPSKSTGPNMNAKITPPLPQRIPHQPVIFSDRFDGGMHKIDVQFGNLGESYEDPSSTNISGPIPPSSSSAFYQRTEPMSSTAKSNNTLSAVQNSQRPTTAAAATMSHHSTEQSAFISPSARPNTARPSEQQQQQPVINQQRVLPLQMQQQQQQQQQPSMTMKQVVPPQYAVHHQQQQLNPQNLILQSLIYQPQQESVPLDTSYDPTFQLQSMDFGGPYFLPQTLNQQATQQQQNQPRYLVQQPHLSHQQQQQQQSQQQTGSNRQSSSNNVQTGSLAPSSSSVPSSSTSNTSSSAPKKGPALPPGMFLTAAPPTPPAYSTAYSTTYGVPSSVSGQPQGSATAYSHPYDAEHMLASAFMQLANAQQAQSPSGVYGSVTPPVQQQSQQQSHTNENKAMSYRAPMSENLLLLQQQFQQYSMPQSNSQQQGQQGPTHSSAQLGYYLGHPGSGPSYSPGPQIMFAQPTSAMAQQQQQQTGKQQGQHYNQNNSSSGMSSNEDYYGRGSSSSTKDTSYMYTVPPQSQQIPTQSVGQQQQQGVNKQQRGGGGGGAHVYNNNQHNQSRSFQ